MDDKKTKIKRIFAYILVAVLVAMGTIFFVIMVKQKGMHAQRGPGFLSVSFYAAAYILWQNLNGKPLSKALTGVLKFVQKAAVAIFMSVSKTLTNLFGFRSNKEKFGLKYIKDYSDETVKIGRNAKVKKRKVRFSKWSELDDAGKVRYIYKKRVYKKIKSGYDLDLSLTPLEVYGDMIKKKTENAENKEIYEMYNLARYNENAKIPAEFIQKNAKAR